MMFVIERSDDEGKKISTGRYKPDSIKIQEHIASQNLLVYRNMVLVDGQKETRRTHWYTDGKKLASTQALVIMMDRWVIAIDMDLCISMIRMIDDYNFFF